MKARQLKVTTFSIALQRHWRRLWLQLNEMKKVYQELLTLQPILMDAEFEDMRMKS